MQTYGSRLVCPNLYLLEDVAISAANRATYRSKSGAGLPLFALGPVIMKLINSLRARKASCSCICLAGVSVKGKDDAVTLRHATPSPRLAFCFIVPKVVKFLAAFLLKGCPNTKPGLIACVCRFRKLTY